MQKKNAREKTLRQNLSLTTEEQSQESSYARSLIEASLDPLVTISPEGKIMNVNEATIKVTGVPRSTEKDDKTVYYVRDNGVGFDSKHADTMFSPFQRLHTEQEFEGTGIGLAIVEQIVRRHGGTIWAEGAVGKGATIYFTLG